MSYGIDIFCDASVVNLFGTVMANKTVCVGAYGYYIPEYDRYKVDIIKEVNASLVNYCELLAFHKTLAECQKLTTNGIVRIHTDANYVFTGVNKLIQLKELFGYVPESFYESIPCKKSQVLYRKIAKFDFSAIFVLKIKAHMNKWRSKYLGNNCIDKKCNQVANKHKKMMTEG